MYDQILFPTDGSEPAELALDYALDVASEHDATLHVLNVADTTRDSLTRIQGEVVDVLEREGEQIVDEAAQRGTDRGISVVPEVLQGDPYSTIVEYCNQYELDLIVMATHGRRGLKRFLLGSVTERVINTAEAPVITVNPDQGGRRAYPCRNLLVPVDGSQGAALALTSGIAVAEATGATLHLLHVVETGTLGPDARSVLKDEEMTERANEIVREATETAERAALDAVEHTIETGSPSKKIRSYMEANDVDLAVLGTHGETDFSRYMMGGVSAKLVRTSPVPVMWVREPAANGPE